ncbi:LysR family transcriptional regulator [Lacrimispora sp. JR3]|uniref:LysR family transcriptional regulator n=1 Tax=Lacrimispora sinapis TaxID=3111456 RepID=UPI00374A4382
MSKLLITAAEVAEIMDCSERHGYKLIQEMNGELKAKGYITRAGRVPRKYFFERTGLSGQEETNGEV